MLSGVVYLITLSILLLSGIILLGSYIFIGVRDIYSILNNYNIKRAEACRNDVCGLFYLNAEKNFKACMNPVVTQRKFEKLEKSGGSLKCWWSMKKIDDLPPAEHLTLYLTHMRTFRVDGIWWRIISILFGLVLIMLGAAELYDLFL